MKLTLILLKLKGNPYFLEPLKVHLKEVYHFREVKVLRLNSSLLEKAFTPYRNQYNSTLILDLLERRTGMRERLLAITPVDLYAGSLNFVFGEARFLGRVAVISLFRLRPSYYGEENGKLYLSRIKKEAVHELGHTFGLPHCPNPACVMHFSNSILDTDLKADRPCLQCLKKLKSLLQT